jgi:hypothetical protein
MNTPKLIYLTVVQIFKETCQLPQAIAKAIKQRQRQSVLNELEVERLDRIRNPEKYRGK